MAVLFVKEEFVDPYIVATDSTLIRAKGLLLHKSSKIKGVLIVPLSVDFTQASAYEIRYILQ
jgi:hypothetical protein